MPQNALFRNAKIEFPVSFKLRVIMQPLQEKSDNQAVIQQLLEELDIAFSGWEFKDSRKGKYLRVLVEITLESRQQMDQLYQALQREATVKLAI